MRHSAAQAEARLPVKRKAGDFAPLLLFLLDRRHKSWRKTQGFPQTTDCELKEN
jgi:hypothetical protein